MQAIQDLRVFTCWVMIEQSEDGDGWISHCLEFDIVSQGDSAGHSIEMIKEATAMALVDDLNDGVDPEAVRKRAPAEYWRSLINMMKTGERVPLQKIRSGERHDVKKFAMQIVLPFIRVNELELAEMPPPMDSVLSMPMQMAC